VLSSFLRFLLKVEDWTLGSFDILFESRNFFLVHRCNIWRVWVLDEAICDTLSSCCRGDRHRLGRGLRALAHKEESAFVIMVERVVDRQIFLRILYVFFLAALLLFLGGLCGLSGRPLGGSRLRLPSSLTFFFHLNRLGRCFSLFSKRWLSARHCFFFVNCLFLSLLLKSWLHVELLLNSPTGGTRLRQALLRKEHGLEMICGRISASDL
jgi:hypothetical protein